MQINFSHFIDFKVASYSVCNLLNEVDISLVPYLQQNGQAMVDLKLWFQNDLLKVTKVAECSLLSFCYRFFPPNQLGIMSENDHIKVKRIDSEKYGNF